MEKTYEQKVHYRIVIEGDYTVGDNWEEDLYNDPEEAHDSIIDWLYENFSEVIYSPKFQMKLSDLRIKEEC